MGKIRVMVADSHPLYCEGMCALLGADAGIEVAGQASDGDEVVQKARVVLPDLILMDGALPPAGGVEVTRQLRAQRIACRVLLLTQQEEGLDVVTGMRAGVNGFVSKSANYSDLVSAISRVYQGNYIIHLSIAGQDLRDRIETNEMPARKRGYEELSHRERQILELVAEGHRTRDIAGRLGIAAQTVSGHRANIMRKLGVHGQTEMVKFAILRRLKSLENAEEATHQHS